MRKHILEQYPETEFLSFTNSILEVYNHTCAVTGMRIDTPVMTHLVRACHIVPYSKLPDDSSANGIALSPTLQEAFAEGLISIDENYCVLVSRFVQDSGPFSLTQFRGKKLHLPKHQSFWPSQLHLEWHREEVFFG